MLVTIEICRTLRQFTQGKDLVTSQKRTLAKVLCDLEETFPGIRKEVIGSAERRSRYCFFLNDVHIESDNLEVQLKDGDDLCILTCVGC
jgi:hypothetical protein